MDQTEPVQVCLRCGLQGYVLADQSRNLCHLCVDRETRNAETTLQLKGILKQHLRGWHRPWQGCEFAKTIIGNAILGALEELDPKRPWLQECLAEVTQERELAR